MNRIIPAFILFLLIAQPSSAQSDEVTQTLIRQGLTDVYDLNLREARIKFDSLIRRDPDHPQGYFFMSQWVLFKMVSGDPADSLEEQFSEWSDKALAAAELLEKTSESEALFYRGSVYGNLARYQAVRGEFVKAFFNAKKAKRLHEAVLEMNKNYADAYLSIGAYNYYAAALPKWINRVAGLLGLNGDRALGIHQLETAYAGGGIGAVEAEFLLANVYYEEGDYERALKYYDDLTGQFPHNPYLANQKGLVQFALENFADADRTLQSARELTDEHTLPAKAFSSFFLGRISKLKADYSAAINYFQESIDIVAKHRLYNVDAWIGGAAHFQIGECMDLSGNRTAAAENYSKAKDLAHAFKPLIQSAKTRLQSPLSEFEMHVMRARHLALIGRREQSYATLVHLKTQAKDAQAKFMSQICFYLGRLALDSSRYEEAINNFKEAVETQPNDADRKWREPQAHFYLGLCYAQWNRKDQAKEELRKCLDFDDYQESPRIRFRAAALLRSLE